MKLIFLAADEFWHWSHSHWNCIFLLWKNSVFLSSKSYPPSFHNWNLIKNLTKQTPCISRKTPSASGQSEPRYWWTWSDERWAQNKALYPNNPQLAWIIIITFVHYLIRMSRWERNPAFCMLQLRVLWGTHWSQLEQFLLCCVGKLSRTASNQVSVNWKCTIMLSTQCMVVCLQIQCGDLGPW